MSCRIRQPNGQWLKSIKFKLPIIEEDMSVCSDNDTQVKLVSLVAQQDKQNRCNFHPSTGWKLQRLCYFQAVVSICILQFVYASAKKKWGVQRGASPWRWVSNRQEVYKNPPQRHA